MQHLKTQLHKIIPEDELEDLGMAYKLAKIKQQGKEVNLTKLFKAQGLYTSKLNSMNALLGGIDQVHHLLAKHLETDNLMQLLDDTIAAQRASLPKMSNKDKNDLIKMLLEFKRPEEKPNAVQVNFNMDSFLMDKDRIIDGK